MWTNANDNKWSYYKAQWIKVLQFQIQIAERPNMF